MSFQAIVAALVYLTAICNGLTSGYSAILLPQLRTNSSGFESDEEVQSWTGKSRDLFHVHTQVTLLIIGKLQLEKILFACMRRILYIHTKRDHKLRVTDALFIHVDKM
jgi:hypothetical protein